MKRLFAVLMAAILLAVFSSGVIATSAEPAVPEKSTAVETEIRSSIEEIISLGRSDNRVMDHLDHLTNRIGPRLAGSHNHRDACEWARDQFVSMGLHNVHLEKCGEIPVGFNRGQSDGAMITPDYRDLHFLTPAWSAGTRGMTRGEVVLATESVDDLKSLGLELENAWLFWRPYDDRDQNIAFREALLELDQTPAGVIIPSMGEQLHSFGNHRIEWDDLPKIPLVVLLESEWEDILTQVSAEEEVSLEFDIRNYFKKGPIPLHNVVADIPGTDLTNEYVIIGAHIDSWDAGTGACDNGAGVVAAMEAARLLVESDIRPRRTIRFILFGAEEIGMFGSKGYVNDHQDLLPTISAVLNMDQGSDYISGILATDAMAEAFEDVFAPVTSLDSEMPFEIERVAHLPSAITDCCGSWFSSANTSLGNTRGQGAGSSDHAAFLAAGVPAFMWKQSGDFDYGKHVHTHLDTYDAIIPEYMEHSATVIALAAHGIANLDHLLSRESMMEEEVSTAGGTYSPAASTSTQALSPGTGSDGCSSTCGSGQSCGQKPAETSSCSQKSCAPKPSETSKTEGGCCPSGSSTSTEPAQEDGGCCPSSTDTKKSEKKEKKKDSSCGSGCGVIY